MYLDKKFPFIRTGTPEITVIPEEPEERAVVKGLDKDVEWLGILNPQTVAGVTVNEDTALTFSAVWAAVKLLSESVAGLPLQVFESNDTGKIMRKEHPTYTILHDNPNKIQTRFTFLQTLMTSVLLYGNGFARIKKDKFARPSELIFIHPDDCTVHYSDGKLAYEVFDSLDGSMGKSRVYQSRDMLHILGLSTNGLTGKGIVKVAQESIGLGLAAEQFGNAFFGNGANSEMAYSSPAVLNDEQYTRMQKLLKDRNSGLKNAHKPLLLEGGMEVKQLTIPPEQAQFLQTRKFQVNEVARWFNIPPHLIADLERSTNNNIEQQSIEFVQHSVMPWLNRIEQECTRKLFYEDEKPRFFVEFNVEGLLRGDVKARSEYYRTLWNIGVLNANEIRSKENFNPYDKGEVYFRPVNMLDVTKELENDTSANSDTNGQGETV